MSRRVSSDILMALMHGLGPEERGLVRNDRMPVWEFPPDYITRLRGSLLEHQPEPGHLVE